MGNKQTAQSDKAAVASSELSALLADRTRTELEFKEKGLSALPPEIGQLTSLTTLSLNNNKLSSLPAKIVLLTALRTLDLHSNSLRVVPPELYQLTNLRMLNLGGTRLTVLPPEIGQLCNLEYLVLGVNTLSTLPPEVSQLSNLFHLDLDSNQLAVLPQEIGQLSNLQNLYLSDNKFTDFPPEIFQLTKLSQLNLSSNRLTVLPPQIGRLTALNYLNLIDNQISALPPKFCRLNSLTFLKLAGNPLVAPPLAVVEGCKREGYRNGYDWSGLARYFDSKLHTNRNVKVILLGAAMAGKTSLRQSVIQGSPDCTLERDRTLCFDVQPACEAEWQKGWIVTWWDFGGQHDYWSVQQPFLSHEALYLLVLHGGKLLREGFDFEDSAGRWLDMLESKVPGAVVLPVVTHLDEIEGKLDQVRAQAIALLRNHLLKRAQRFELYSARLKLSEEKCQPAAVGLLLDRMVVMSSKTAANLHDLRAAILTGIQKLPVAGQRVPVYYTQGQEVVDKLRVEEEVKGEERVMWRSFEDLVSEITRRTSLDGAQAGDVLKFLNGIGSVRIVAKSMVMLRPADLFMAIKHLVRHDLEPAQENKELQAYARDQREFVALQTGLNSLHRDGILDEAVADYLLQKVLPSERNEGARRSILELLVHSGVLVGTERLLLPCRLPMERPRALSLKFARTFRARVVFGEAFPDLCSQLLAKLLNIKVGSRRVELLGQWSYLWQTGSFMHWGSHLFSDMFWSEEDHAFLVTVLLNEEAVAVDGWRLLRVLLSEVQQLVHQDRGRQFPQLEVWCPKPSCDSCLIEFEAEGNTVCHGCGESFSIKLEGRQTQ